MPEKSTIDCAITVAAPLTDVWDAWTTEAGAVSFFAPAARITAEPGGPYELLFNLEAPENSQGGEGMVVLAVQSPRFISFTWNAPPHLPEVRPQRTWVEVRLEATGPSRTQVHLTHGGWGSGGEWDEAFAYFSNAWAHTVLPRLAHRFSVGPIDWQNPPKL